MGARGIVALGGLRLRRLGHSLQRHPAGLDRNGSDRVDDVEPGHKKDTVKYAGKYHIAAKERQGGGYRLCGALSCERRVRIHYGTDIVVDGGWFSAAPYLTNERSHHMLQILEAKDKAEGVLGAFLKHFK
jgi:hypothetical protein